MIAQRNTKCRLQFHVSYATHNCTCWRQWPWLPPVLSFLKEQCKYIGSMLDCHVPIQITSSSKSQTLSIQQNYLSTFSLCLSEPFFPLTARAHSFLILSVKCYRESQLYPFHTPQKHSLLHNWHNFMVASNTSYTRNRIHYKKALLLFFQKVKFLANGSLKRIKLVRWPFHNLLYSKTSALHIRWWELMTE